MARFWRGKLGRLRNARATTLFYHTGLSRIIAEQLPPGTGMMLQEPPIHPPCNEADIAARKALFATAPAADAFQRLAAEVMPFLIPKSLVEDFRDWRKLALRAPLPSSVRTLITSYGLTGDDLCSHQIVLAIRNGAALCGMQHGGGYGSYRICPAEDHESRCSDHWLSWGAQDAPNQVPLPPLRCVGLSVRKHEVDQASRLILVGSDRHPLTYRVMSEPMSGQMANYFHWQERFFLALHDNARAQFRLRPYFLDFGNPGHDWWKGRGIATADDGVAELLSRDRLFVFDHNGTGFLETLCLDVPTLLYWNPAVWKLRDSAKPAFDIMKAAGMFHETPEAAAAEAGRALADLQGWWNAPAMRAARAAARQRFARPVDFWQKDWTSFLEGVARGRQ
jgi:putative transferase (TIGR04331 family)